MKRLAALSAIGLMSMASASVAQTPPPNSAGSASTSQSLSSKLSKSDGVIKPQSNVDPGIHVPAPDPNPNSTPVVPPSATGGGTAK